MSLKIWLPLNGSLSENISNRIFTNNSATINNAGKIGKCYDFNGLSAQLIHQFSSNDISMINSCTQFTLACWVKLASNQEDGSWGQIVTLGSQGTSWNDIRIGFDAQPNSSTHFSVSDGSSNAGYKCSSNSNLADDKWHHLVGIYDNKKLIMYVDGVQQTLSDTITFTHALGATSYMIVGGNSGEKPKCSINDVRFYDHALSPREVKLLAQGLVAHYKLDGGNHNNLLINTCNPSSTANLVGVPSTCSITYDSKLQRNVFTSSTSATSETYIYSSRSPQVTPGVQYTFSCDMWCNDYVKSTEFFWLSDTADNQKTGTGYTTITNASQSIPVRNQWFHKKWTFTTPTTDYTGYIRIDNNGSSTSGSAAILKVANLKLEKGNKESPYGLNPNEINSLIEYDCSGYQNHGTCSTTFNLANDTPRYGNCKIFENNKYIKCPTHSYEGMKDTYTFSYWAKHGSGTSMDGKMIWGFYDGGYLDVYPSGGYLTWNTGDGGTNLFKDNGISIPYPTDGLWHHYAFTGNGNQTLLYIDGNYKGQAITYRSIPNSGTLFLSGWNTNENQYRWNGGQISDFRLYATTLSAAAVKELYQSSISFLDNGTLQCSEIGESPTNLKYNQNGIVQASECNEVESKRNPLSLARKKKLADGSLWARIHYLDVNLDTFNTASYFTNDTEVGECTDKFNRFSLMKYIENFAQNGKYEFMLTYDIPIRLPHEYTQLEYVTSTGEQYINTGVAYNSSKKIELCLKLKYNTLDVENQIMGFNGNAGNGIGTSGNKFWMDSVVDITINKDSIYNLEWTMEGSVWSRTINHTLYSGNGANTSTTSNLFLFAATRLATEPSNITYGCHCNLYGARIKVANSVVRELVPCIRNYDGAVGMYDLVNKQFYQSNSSTSLKAGPVVRAGGYNRWTQTGTPNSAHNADVGYTAVGTQAFTSYVAPLRKTPSGYSGDSLYAANNSSNWWAPIGQKKNYNGGIPAANNTTLQSTELWVRIPTLTKLSMFDKAIQTSQIYEL